MLFLKQYQNSRINILRGEDIIGCIVTRQLGKDGVNINVVDSQRGYDSRIIHVKEGGKVQLNFGEYIVYLKFERFNMYNNSVLYGVDTDGKVTIWREEIYAKIKRSAKRQPQKTDS